MILWYIILFIIYIFITIYILIEKWQMTIKCKNIFCLNDYDVIYKINFPVLKSSEPDAEIYVIELNVNYISNNTNETILKNEYYITADSNYYLHLKSQDLKDIQLNNTKSFDYINNKTIIGHSSNDIELYSKFIISYKSSNNKDIFYDFYNIKVNNKIILRSTYTLLLTLE